MISSFHPLAAAWFTETFGAPTAVQEAAWPLIARGEDLLAVAPTGSGKTLTAFLAALSRFIDGSWDPEKLTVLYVSPLKALNEDIRRNLLEPVEELRNRAAAAAVPFPGIRVETRSGDTPQAERRRFFVRPPSILAVTPESLAILLLNPRGREALSRVRYLVLDEIHAVMGTKRGAFLSCQIDRLAGIAGSFQRIALSATVHPETAAEYAGVRRIIAPPAEKKIDFLVEFPREEAGKNAGENGVPKTDRYGKRYTVLVNYILDRIRNAGAGGGMAPNGGMTPDGERVPKGIILVFTDSRRRAERITYLVNAAAGERLALCHHGSLSKEVRRDVEQSLVRALVPCVVATSSLELGLDIGAVEEVILAGAPSSCARTLQRVGRAGHGAGRTSRGRLLPFHGLDLLLGAVMAEAVTDREIERIRPVKNPLDILAQIVLALLTEEPRDDGGLYAKIRGFRVFRNLDRSSFDGVIAMLTGRLFRELEPRLYRDTDGKLYPAAGVLSLLYSSGGVIPGRGLYSMRLPDGTKIGELDEEFVWERRLGDSFDFGARPWAITAIGSEAVTVTPRTESADFTPFWKADVPFRSPELSLRILRFFDSLNNTGIPETAFSRLSEEARRTLEDLLARQKKAQGSVPFGDENHIPLEIIDDPAVRQDAYQAVFHTFRGGGVNYPLAMALAGALEERTGQRIEAVPDDNAVLLLVPRLAAGNGGHAEALLREAVKDCAKKRRGEDLFRRRLETSGIFGAAFREAAERSMILPRGRFGRRTPLWVMRQRAKRLYDKVSGSEQFPLINEAWRSCLEDRFDMEGFAGLLEALDRGTVRLCPFITGNPSPFARDLVWKETGNFMYDYDERKDLLGAAAAPGSRPGGYPAGVPDESLAGRAITRALADPSRMPVIRAELAASFGARLRREIPGWAPEEARELARWVLDRTAIPADEWKVLRSALPEELKEQLEADPSLEGRLGERTLEGASLSVIVHSETAAALTGAEDSALSRLGEWLRYEGPVSAERVARIFGCGEAAAEDALDALVEAGEAAGGITVEGSPAALYCDAENCGLLLRLARKRARPVLAERPSPLLVPFTALRQGLLCRDKPEQSTAAALETLAAYPLPVKLWETEILPARAPAGACGGKQLDALLASGSLLWFGAGKEKAAFCTPEELELADPGETGGEGPKGEISAALTRFCAEYKNFWEIRDHLAERNLIPPGRNAPCAEFLWDAAWRGELSSDSWEALRRGISRGFALREEAPKGPGGRDIPGILPRYAPGRERRIPRALRERWREGAPLPGRWYALAGETDPAGTMPDSLLEEDLNRDRVRLLLRRWGILCRPLLETEGCFSWSRLLPAMRRMELAGELVTGRFFAGIHSLQFAAPSIPRELEAMEEAVSGNAVPGAPVYWMNAADPASPAGWNIEGLDSRLPPRTSASRLCFRGPALAAVSSKSGRELELFIPPGDPGIGGVLSFLTVPRTRACHPVQKITLETVNGSSAAKSPYAAALEAAGFIPDRDKLILW
ncbi:MAG: DEAD/DEAH box helicase [Spirochaetaceae bacterium]|jgi:ATP-dependent Lhr-like helicase|nr:DEAD/DEAH box helicase [Spirochaetaceae bacterium]